MLTRGKVGLGGGKASYEPISGRSARVGRWKGMDYQSYYYYSKSLEYDTYYLSATLSVNNGPPNVLYHTTN